jgi:hypothetical protein
MAPHRGADWHALVAAGLLLLTQTAFADDVRLRLPTQDANGDENPVTLPPRGREADVTALAIDAGIGETDNILRTPSARQSQTIALVGADFELRRATRLLDADLRGDFNYIDYLQNAFGTQLVGRFDGSAGWQIWPERLKWVLDDSFGQAQLDPLAAVTPRNLEHVNVVSTGPDLTLRPWQALFVKLSARDAYAAYATSPFDNNRVLGELAIGHDFSLGSNISANADVQLIRFTNTFVNHDYDRRNFYGAYAARGARTLLSFDLGVSQANESGRWTSTPFVRLELTRAVSAAALLQLSAGRQYSDVSDSFRGLQSGATGRIAIGPATGTAVNYLDQYATVLWRFTHLRTSLDVSAGWEKNTFASGEFSSVPAVSPDVERATLEAKITRHLTSAFTAEISGRAARERYYHAGFADNDYLGSAGLAYRPARRLEVKVKYDHESRIATGRAQGFVENRLMLTVGYRIIS